MQGKQALLVICDGMGDRPQRDYGNRTPLEAAYTPHLDRLVKGGWAGLMDPVDPGIPPGSDVAHFSIFGYDPYKYYTGRGGLEAAGVGIKLAPEDVAFRCNFSTTDNNLVVVDRRAGRIRNGTQELAKALTGMQLKTVQDVTVEFVQTIEHRGVLVLRGSGLSRHVSDVDPHQLNVRVLQSKPLDNSSEARRTADAVNEFTSRSNEVLKDHPVNLERIRQGEKPANIILSRGAGTFPQLTPLSTLYGVRTGCIAVVALVRGICKIAGMEVIDVKGATGGLDTDFMAKADAATRALESYDYVLLHVKATDVAGHDGNFEAKQHAIESIDKMIGKLIDAADPSRTYIAVTADHTTAVSVKDHSGDPVPLLIAGPDVIPSEVTKFCEKTVSHGNLGRIRGFNLTPILMNYLGKTSKFGY